MVELYSVFGGVSLSGGALVLKDAVEFRGRGPI